MNLVDFSTSSLSVLPAVLALGLAIITRRVLLSLGLGILSGALLLNDFSLTSTTSYLSNLVFGLFVDDGSINTWNMSIVAFLMLLGAITALLTLSGGTRAFAEWAQSRVKSKRGAKLLAAFLGVFIFVDDYFNSLAVGAISRPVTDRFHVSRAKLAYILDSTAAPMCVIMPASSWGAYIITVIGGILVSHGVTEYSPLSAFAHMIPMNFYAVFALAMVFAVAWFQMDVGPMRRFEYEASTGSRLGDDENHVQAIDDELGIVESEKGRVSDLIIPIVVLVVATMSWMVFSGAQVLEADGKAFSVLGAFENTDVGMSLLYGGAMGLLSALITVFKQGLPVADVARTTWVGAKSMFGAILILFFAWTIGNVIGDMATGKFLSTLIQGNLSPQLLPVLLFLISAAMAFSTGTSWGTFGIMLPIAGDLAGATDIAMMLPMLSAVLAGAVFGDHCSPISDTTILSSTGARCGHIDHVSTQLPYALATAAVAAVGYLVLGFTDSLSISLLAGGSAFVVVCALFGWLSRRPGKLA
ncbi:Na+/H+ antiporter NhaC family protein [Enterovibrio paralichthyis]|uniref:Na+/H+ antiporter NhaC family protein n=1 Tax=Enterovibrio paralichthyis TaxID=2853805 RepID=UPI001C451DD5|nr:Na+/H+ antiporter NhaC family protein [Enterovibrio paralichthyis]MBV7299539.1 Na+/H+ antiporter NhaC family protein [Enterovibrio paralichthyis]